jgi:hypothetical protein
MENNIKLKIFKLKNNILYYTYIMIEISEPDKKKDFYKKKSETMKGENHFFYGKQLSPQHSQNISLGLIDAKRPKSLTNEKIKEIYSMKDKLKQVDASKLYGFHRDTIRKIWNKKILPTDSEEFLSLKEDSSKKENIQKSISISKRSLSIDEIILIIQYKEKKKNGELLDNHKIFSTNLSQYLSKEWNKTVTIDMIKNIWNGRTRLFENEFENKDLTFEDYQKIISI